MDRRHAWAPQGRCETGRGQFPVVADSRAREAARASITTPPDFHRVRAESNTEIVSPTSSGGSRPATSHDIAIAFFSEPKSSRSVREGTERMPRIGNHAQQSGVLTRTERIVANLGEMSASTAVESGDGPPHEVPDCAIDVNGDSQQFGPLQGRSGPSARWDVRAGRDSNPRPPDP
jgi:hypothetical protein